MTLDEILESWKKDGPIDSSELANEAAVITPKLHHKYLTLYSNERLRLRYMEANMRRLKLAKHEFYIQGPSKETNEKGWEPPAIGKIMRTDSVIYIDADKDINELQLKIDYTKEKIDTLNSIISQINGRSYLIGHAISDIKWKGGI